jgi:transposase
MPKRQRVAPTDTWEQLEIRFTDPTQRTYELIRPVVLFGQSPSERAQETTTSERTLYRHLERFAVHGMSGLDPERPVAPSNTLPPGLRHLIVELKAEHPPLRINEIMTICYVRTGRRPDAKTVKRVLTDTPLPFRATRRYLPYHEIAEPAERRKAVIRLHAEGWTNTAIAEYLRVSRKTVQRTLQRWITEGVRGLPDKSHARRRGGRKVDLKAISIVRRLQRNPGLGEFRIHTALRQLGIHLSPRTCGRILALNRTLYGLPHPTRAQREKQAMPFAASRRHQFWTVDIRYLDHTLGGGNVYCISILENYSRAILASGLSRSQDLTAYLIILYAAVRQHGTPEVLVSDGGSVFKAKQALEVYQRLGIVKEQIDKGQAWQSYIETNFNVQRRMADWHFTQAKSWQDLLTAHEQWVADFNFQQHWAHRHREDGRHSPAEVLGWVLGRVYAPEDLHRTFCTTRFGRRLDPAGYVRFRHWRVYGERGLPGQAAAVWLCGETLTVAFGDTPLAQYRVSYQPDLKHLRTIDEPHILDTPYRSPQLPLWTLGDGEWLKVVRLPEYVRLRRPRIVAAQAAFAFECT